MDFRGHLRLPQDAGSGIPVVLRLDDIFVSLTSEGDELGVWRADEVEVDRIFSNEFSLDLDGEPMVFIASDALGFAYEGVTAIAELQERLAKRRVFRRKKARKDRVAVAVDDEVQPTQQPAPSPSEAPAWSAPEVADPRPYEPPAEPVRYEPPPPSPAPPPPRPAPTWEEQPAASAWAEPTEGAPVDERVSYGSPAVTSGTEVEEVTAETVISAASEVAEIEIDDDWVMPAAAAADTYRPSADRTPVAPVERPAPAEVEPAPPPRPEAVGDAPPAPPTYRPAPTRRRPAEDRRSVPAESPLARLEAATPSPPPPPVAAPSTPARPPIEPRPVDPPPAESRPEPVVHQRSEPAGASPADQNGHGRVERVSKTVEEPPEKRGRLLFGRAKDRETEHDHVYGTPNTIGGLTRAVCEICGHVTFRGEDVYQGW